MRRHAKKRTLKKEPPKVAGPPGGGENWSRFVVVAVAVGLIIWYMHNQSERAALLDQAARNALAQGGTLSTPGTWGAGAGALYGQGQDASQGEGEGSSRSEHHLREYHEGMGKALDMLSGTPSHPPLAPSVGQSATDTSQAHSGAEANSWGGSEARTVPKLRVPRVRKWAPINGSFVLRWGRVRRRYLGSSIAKEKLTPVMLDANRFGTENALLGAPTPSVSRGPPCPDFEYAYEGFPDIGSCWQEGIEDPTRSPSKYPYNCRTLAETCVQETDFRPHEKWAAQVLVLHNVYVNLAGQVFNETHYFDHNECAFEQVFQYRANRTRVLHFRELVHMIDWYAWSARSFMLELLPMWVSLQKVLPAMRGVPVAFGHRLTHKRNQLEQMIAQGAKQAIGLEFDRLNFYILQGSDLFFSERLVVPLHQRCGNPSRSMWTLIRNRHFLQATGIPIFNPDYTSTLKGAPRPVGTTWDREDWVVLLAYNLNSQAFVFDRLQLEKKLQEVFPPERVIQYKESSLTIPRRKELLNRARLMISVRDNVLADMVFMPPGAAVLEIRPIEDPDPTFHLLAEVCGLRYYLLFTEGYRKTLPKDQAYAKLKVKDPRALDRLLNKMGARLQTRPNATAPSTSS